MIEIAELGENVWICLPGMFNYFFCVCPVTEIGMISIEYQKIGSIDFFYCEEIAASHMDVARCYDPHANDPEEMV